MTARRNRTREPGDVKRGLGAGELHREADEDRADPVADVAPRAGDSMPAEHRVGWAVSPGTAVRLEYRSAIPGDVRALAGREVHARGASPSGAGDLDEHPVEVDRDGRAPARGSAVRAVG